jgi:hypothetical protein
MATPFLARTGFETPNYQAARLSVQLVEASFTLRPLETGLQVPKRGATKKVIGVAATSEVGMLQRRSGFAGPFSATPELTGAQVSICEKS